MLIFPKKSENGLIFPKKSENGLNFPKKSDNGLNFPPKNWEWVNLPQKVWEWVNLPQKVWEWVKLPQKVWEWVKLPQKVRIAEDDMPVPAKPFTDSYAKDFADFAVQKHILILAWSLPSTIQMIAWMFVVILMKHLQVLN